MGNSNSKRAKAQLEKEAAQNASDLAARDQELARAEKGLEVSKMQEDRLHGEAEALRRKCAELETLSQALEQEREKHIVQLQAALILKGDEVVAQRRVVESRTQERDDARRQMGQLEERLELIEQKSQMSTEEFERRRRSLETSVQARERSLEQVRTESNALSEKVRLLERKHEEMTVEFGHAKSTAEEKLVASRLAAEQEVSSIRATAASELSLAKASMTESAHNLAAVSSELLHMKAALSTTTSKLDTLTKSHNESVTRRAASHEAFTATKQELAEAQEKYLNLYDAHEKRGRDLEEHLSAARKDVSSAQEKHERLQAAHDQLAIEHEDVRKALGVERDGRDALRAELTALRKALVESETRKTVADIQVQTLILGNDVEAAA